MVARTSSHHITQLAKPHPWLKKSPGRWTPGEQGEKQCRWRPRPVARVVHRSVWKLRLGVCFVAGRNYHFFQTCLSGRKCSTSRQSGYSWSERAANPSLGARRRRPCRRRFCPGIPALARRRGNREKNELSRCVSIRTVNFDAVHSRRSDRLERLLLVAQP